MKAAVGVLFGACSLACAIVAPAAVRADGETGGTYVTTLPSGAEVWFDGTYVGRSPLLVDGLAIGRHSLSVVKTGWQGQDDDVEIAGGTVMMSSIRLAPGKRQTLGEGASVGTLVVRDPPRGAEITLDGAPLSSEGSKGVSLPTGTHEIVVRTARGRTRRLVRIYPQLVTDVILREASARSARSAVLAAAEDYLPTDAFVVEGRRIVVRYGGHVVIARFGETRFRIDGTTTSYDSAPEAFGGKLYLPLALLEKLSGDVSKDR